MNEPHLVQADYNRLLELTSENVEQCRLLSMSAEREYNLRGKIERLERELAIAKHSNDVLMIGMKAIDERVKESKDAEADLKYCGEIVFAAIASLSWKDKEMSDTPRMDAAWSKPLLKTPSMNWKLDQCYLEGCKLERELAEARELAEMQKETMQQMREQYGIGERNVMRDLKQQRDRLEEALMRIEERYVDGDNTYEDWRAMGKIAQEALEEKTP